MALIFSDIDDTACDLLTEWLRRYNLDYPNYQVKKEDITDWDMERFLAPECGNKIYKYLSEPDLYDCIPVLDGVKESLAELRGRGHRVVFATAGNHWVKRNWLFKHGLIDNDKDIVAARDKGLLKGDYLIDDGFHNIQDFQGIGILYDANHNKHHNYPLRVTNWECVVRTINTIECAKSLFSYREIINAS